MKHVFTSAGFLALGAAALQAYDPEIPRQLNGRMWTVAASVRGFYDDNPTTSHSKEQETFGVEVSPSAHLYLPLEQTFISLGYIYRLKWYDDLHPHNTDQSHEFNGKLRHQFGPKHDIGVDDTFVYTTEPTIVDKGGIVTTPLRTDADVLHNRGSIDDNIWLTPVFGLNFGYLNHWYDYGQDNIKGQPGSRSALLDRLEHYLHIDGRYQVSPNLVALVGYQVGITTFTADEAIGPSLKSDDRNSISHYGYAGADYDLTSKLRASARVGGQFTDYHELDESTANPYADFSLTYVYLPNCSVEVGVQHMRNATDVAQVDKSGLPTFDAETTVAYLQITHQITRKLTGSVLGQYQTSTFNNGQADDKGEDMWLAGVNLAYHFNRYFTAEAGYNFDALDSDLHGRSFTRNRAYIGLRAGY